MEKLSRKSKDVVTGANSKIFSIMNYISALFFNEKAYIYIIINKKHKHHIIP